MDVSGQLHPFVTVPAVGPSVPVELEAGWAVRPLWSAGEDISPLLLAVIEPRFLGLSCSHSPKVVEFHLIPVERVPKKLTIPNLVSKFSSVYRSERFVTDSSKTRC